MKKVFLLSISCLFYLKSNAEKTTTTTRNVVGTAKTVTVNQPPGGGSVTSIQCDPTFFTCYTETTTTTTPDKSPKQGDHVVLEVYENGHVTRTIEGGFIEKSAGLLPDGSIQYYFSLSPNWTEQ